MVPLTAIDRRTDQKLKRGRIEIEATLDLHGLTEARAHARLNTFLKGAVEDGRRTVLVITGKGGARGGGESFMPSDRRGVLREAVPRWIVEPPLCDLVWGLRPAGQRHGGAGAFYVLLKKVRKPRG
ncbi:MAG: Smr/MutS family protein [Alphaproteobacteria bacterium]